MMNDQKVHAVRVLGRFQLSLHDTICLLSLHAVVMTGMVQLVQTLATEATEVVSVLGPVGQTAERDVEVPIERLNHVPLLMSAIAVGSVLVWLGFLCTRHFVRGGSVQLQQSAPRIGASVASLLFVAVFLIFKVGVPPSDASGHLDGYWMIADLAARWQAFGLALAATVVIVCLELLPLAHGAKKGQKGGGQKRGAKKGISRMALKSF
jgi:hypothetical protein